MERTVEIDIWSLISACWRRVWLIVACAVIAGAVALCYTLFFVTPLYEASATFYVNNSSTGANTSISSSDLSTAQRLVATYVNIIKSDTVLDKVIEEGKLDLTAPQLRKLMDAESVEETEMFKVFISHPDPNMAAQIANAIAAVAPTEIQNIMIGSATKVIDYAKVPQEPYSPSTIKNTVLGGLVGFVLAVAVVVAQQLLDRRIKTEEDLTRIANMPVLGVIPDFHAELKASYPSFGSDKKKKATR